MSEGYIRPGRILIIENELVVRNFISAYYRLKGFEVTEADNAESAIPHVPNANLIISDIDQPNSQGGYWLLSYVRENHKSIPVILMSGRPVARERAHGAAAFFQKPFSKSDLEDMLLAMPENLTPTQHLKPPQTPPSA